MGAGWLSVRLNVCIDHRQELNSPVAIALRGIKTRSEADYFAAITKPRVIWERLAIGTSIGDPKERG